MSVSTPMSPSVVCLLCPENHVLSLGSILVMLKPYLSRVWRAEPGETGQAVLRIVNLDHPDGPALLQQLGGIGPRVLACAQRPRQHAPGTVHRPFRGYEILAALKELERIGFHGASVGDASAVRRLETDRDRSFQLRSWPTDFEKQPREWWRILASLRARRLTMAQLSQQLQLSRATVAECLDWLLHANAVSVEFDMDAAAATAKSGMASLLNRVGSHIMDKLRRRA